MTNSAETDATTADDGSAPEPVETARPVAETRPLTIPVRTLPVLLILLAIGSIPFLFAFATIHKRSTQELQLSSLSARQHYTINYWLEHGYFSFAGLSVRQTSDRPYIYRSSTGGRFISAFVVAKIYAFFTGRYGWHLLAVHNQLVSLLTSALLGLLGFRLALRAQAKPFHALILGASVLIVHFTFPDNLALYWEITGRVWWLLFVSIFLLLDERAAERRTRALTIAQAVSVFLLAYMEYIAGVAFIASYVAITLIVNADRILLRRLMLSCVLPVVMALSVFAAQRALVSVLRPDMPKEGSTFLFRTGLDGSSQYYGSHLGIALNRDIARKNWPENNRGYLFRWKWLFVAGTAALLLTVVAAARARVPLFTVVAVASLLGAYLIYAAVFSQAMVIHPYLYDVMIFTPLILALLVVVPSFLETLTIQKGVVVVFVFFLTVWVSMVHLRDYALRYPPKLAPESAASIAGTAA